METKWHSCRPLPVVERMASAVQVEIRQQPFSPWAELEQWGGDAAADAVFLGRVRGQTMDGRTLQALELEHYAGLCEQCIKTSAQTFLSEYEADAALVLHRVGRLLPGEVIVLVAVHADRRSAALNCCAALLEDLKHGAPFWKREWCNGQGTWLASNTPR